MRKAKNATQSDDPCVIVESVWGGTDNTLHLFKTCNQFQIVKLLDSPSWGNGTFAINFMLLAYRRNPWTPVATDVGVHHDRF